MLDRSRLTSLLRPSRARNKTRQSLSPQRLQLEPLEDRVVPATFTESGTTLALGLGTGETVGIASTASTYTLSLGSPDTWSGTDNGGLVTGATTSTLTVTSAGITAFSTGITVSDTASTGGDAVAFNNSGSNSYASNFSITLTHSSSGATTPGLAFNGTTTFANASTLTASVNGDDVLVNVGATLGMDTGALSLSATGANAPLTVNGTLTSSTGNVGLSATGALAVGTLATVNSGTGTLSLDADRTASGTGTLSIDAGATVVSNNSTASAVTLRGAAVNLATSAAASTGLGATPSASLTGLTSPQALAIDSAGDVFVANSNTTTVSEFTASALSVLKGGEHDAHRHPLRAGLSRCPGVRLRRRPLRRQQHHGERIHGERPQRPQGGEHDAHRHPLRRVWAQGFGVRLRRRPLRRQREQQHGERVHVGTDVR